MKIILDCGSYWGNSVDKFRSLISDIDDYKIFMFEPNPAHFSKIQKNSKYDSCIKYNKAVSIKNGISRLYGNFSDDTFCGYTLKTEKANFDKTLESYFDVETIDIVEFIENNLSKDDSIILKLDVEGEEYDILEKIIKNNMEKRFDKIYCEFHSQWLNHSFYEREFKIKQYIPNIEYWDALS